MSLRSFAGMAVTFVIAFTTIATTSPSASAASVSPATDACFAEYTGDNATDFSSPDASALRSALAAVAPGGMVKLAGTCAGTIMNGGSTQVALVTKTVTIAGGYSPANWTTSFPLTQVTSLHANLSGRVLVFSGVPGNVANLSLGDGSAVFYGGGIYASDALTLTSVDVLDSVAGVVGGGVFAVGAVTLNGGLIRSNRAQSEFGGGVYTLGPLAISGTQMLSNTAGLSGGGAFASGAIIVSGGVFQGNWADDGYGGGLSGNETLELSGTQFLGNMALNGGGGAYAVGAMTVTGGLFQGNWVPNGGGGGLFGNATLALSATQFLSNTTPWDGGGAVALGDLNVTNARFASNTAGRWGGGLYQFAGRAQIVNALFDRNMGGEAALYFRATSQVAVIQTTIASPTLSSGGAIVVLTGTLNVTNTIIASHAIGISRTGGTVNENFNLFFGNSLDRATGILTGTNSLSGDPRFENPWAGNYHIGPGSAAINSGTNAGVMTDFEGTPRPYGAGFDIGYDEWVPPRAYLPLLTR